MTGKMGASSGQNGHMSEEAKANENDGDSKSVINIVVNIVIILDPIYSRLWRPNLARKR
jgi:hypothetical protein